MKREEILERLGFKVAPIKKKRVIVHSDIKCEADDQLAIVHHLLSPTFNVKGIVASHFERRFAEREKLKQYRYTSMMQSFEEGEKLLDLMGIDDVPLLKGSIDFLKDAMDLPESEGADFIIAEAMKDDEAPLFIALQGALTDLAIAYKKEPRIAERLTAIWIGGAAYPEGGAESNLGQDIIAARILFDSPMPIWQIPSSVYLSVEVSLAELADKVRPYGNIGRYLMERVCEVNDFYGQVPIRLDFPHGESWCMGDSPTVSVLLQNAAFKCWHMEKAPLINDDMTYSPNPQGKAIRVYDGVDTRLTMDDFFSKLRLCYSQA